MRPRGGSGESTRSALGSHEPRAALTLSIRSLVSRLRIARPCRGVGNSWIRQQFSGKLLGSLQIALIGPPSMQSSDQPKRTKRIKTRTGEFPNDLAPTLTQEPHQGSVPQWRKRRDSGGRKDERPARQVRPLGNELPQFAVVLAEVNPRSESHEVKLVRVKICRLLDGVEFPSQGIRDHLGDALRVAMVKRFVDDGGSHRTTLPEEAACGSEPLHWQTQLR